MSKYRSTHREGETTDEQRVVDAANAPRLPAHFPFDDDAEVASQEPNGDSGTLDADVRRMSWNRPGGLGPDWAVDEGVASDDELDFCFTLVDGCPDQHTISE